MTKKYKVILNQSALSKLEEILDFISIDSPKRSISVINEIIRRINSLESMPERFPAIQENIKYKTYQIRHFYCKNSFRVIYTIREDEVRILCIRHGAQKNLTIFDIN